MNSPDGREPHFDVVRLRRGEAHVSRAQLHDAIVQTELLKDQFGIGNQRFEFRVTFFRPRELEHFDFLKLVLALQAARIFPGGSGLGAETGCPRAELDRQGVGVESFIAIETGKFDFGRRRQPKVRAFEVKHIRREFRQLAHAGQRRRVHDERRKNFRVPACRMRIEEKIRQCPFHPRAEAAIQCESRAGDFRCALKIKDSGALGDFPVRPRREIKFRRRAPTPHFDICRGVMTHRHRTVRHGSAQ